MAESVDVYLFDKLIAKMYREGDRYMLRQFHDGAHRASPISIPQGIEDYDSTALRHLEGVPGFISDSLPGSFGTEILRNYFESNNSGRAPTVIDKLLFIGDRGLGALSFRPSRIPREEDLETLKLKDIFDKARSLKQSENYSTLHDALLVAVHSFAGGARAKAVVSLDLNTHNIHLGHRNIVPEGYTPVIVKYDDTDDGSIEKSLYSKLEYIYYLLATKAGIPMSKSHLLHTDGRYHFITERFDLQDGKRRHMHSFAGLLHLDYNISMSTSYEELLRTARQLNVPHSSYKQLLSQMLFNYLFVNQDDHSRNFSFITDNDFNWEASPAYDITYAKGQGQTVEHQLTLYGKRLSAITLEDVGQLAGEFDIDTRWLGETIEKMLELRERDLPDLLKTYEISDHKTASLLNEVNKRDFGGV